MNGDGALLAELRGRRDGAVGVGKKQICRDRDVPARSLHGLSQDLAILQDDKLRIDVHAPAAAVAIKHRGTDPTIGELHRAAGGRRNLNEPATSLSSLCGHRAIRHGELVAGVDLNVAGISSTSAAGRDRRTIRQVDRPTGNDIDVAARPVPGGLGEDPAPSAVDRHAIGLTATPGLGRRW